MHEVFTRFATQQYLYPSFMMSYWPGLKGFGMDPVGTLPDIVNNSLIHVWEGTLDLLPALPEAWARGSIRGIRLRGQLTVEDLTWDRPLGQVTLSLTSAVTQTLTLRVPERWTITQASVTGDAHVGSAAGAGHTRQLEVAENERVILTLGFRESL